MQDAREKRGLARASSGGLRLESRFGGKKFVCSLAWPSAETIRELFAGSSGGTESTPGGPCGQSGARELLPEIGRVSEQGAEPKTMEAGEAVKENKSSS